MTNSNFWTLLSRLFQPVDIAGLVYFRVIFGTIMLWDAWQRYAYIAEDYIDPVYHFTFFGFAWVRPWSGEGMYVHFVALGVLALGILLGLFYRICAVLLFLGVTYVFLLEQAVYQNHYYLVSLISLIMIFLPANRGFSIDVLIWPEIKTRTAAAWTLWLLRLQVGIPYFYGGLAKLNSDWLHGEPMRMMLAERAHYPLVGQFFTEAWVVYAFAFGGLLFDLMIVPLLLWRRTRIFAYVLALLFHLTNSTLFHIGIFPWFMLFATLIFFPPSWPRRLMGLSAIRIEPGDDAAVRPSMRKRVTVALLAIYLLVQLLVPLRHYLYPGNVNWTEQGHRFSWHMKLRIKDGISEFDVADPRSGKTWTLDPRRHLTLRQFGRMSCHPDMLLQFSHVLAREFSEQGYSHVEVRARTRVSLNGRKPQRLVDPEVDLAAQRRSLGPQPWIMPLVEPLRDEPWWKGRANLPVIDR